MEAAFDSEDQSDITFVVENKPIYVHSFIVSLRSEHLRRMLSGPWVGVKERRIEIREYSYATFYAYLNYLYTDRLDIEPVAALAFLDLASSYGETRLQVVCEQFISSSITVHNVMDLLAASIRHNAPKLREYTIRFVLDNLTALATSPDFARLPDSLAKEILYQAAINNKFVS